MVIQLVVVILLMFWASDREKALPPAIVYTIATIASILVYHGAQMEWPSALMAGGANFALAFLLFWLVAKTGGAVGWIIRIVTVVVLSGAGSFLAGVFSGGR